MNFACFRFNSSMELSWDSDLDFSNFFLKSSSSYATSSWELSRDISSLISSLPFFFCFGLVFLAVFVFSAVPSKSMFSILASVDSPNKSKSSDFCYFALPPLVSGDLAYSFSSMASFSLCYLATLPPCFWFSLSTSLFYRALFFSSFVAWS